MTVSMSAVWDRTSAFLSDQLAPVAGIAALAIFVPGVVTEILSPLKPTAGPGLTLGLGLLSLVVGIISLWGQLAIMAMAIGPATDAAAGRALASRRLGPLILVVLAMLSVFVVLMLPIIGTLIANGVDLTRLDQPGALQTLSPGASGLIALYGLILIPVCLWLFARFGVLTAPVVLAEQQTLGALGRAFRLSRELTWKIIGVLLLYVIVMIVAGLAAVTVFGFGFAMAFGTGPGITIASVLTALVTAAVATIFTVLGTVFPAKLYLAVRDREGAIPE